MICCVLSGWFVANSNFTCARVWGLCFVIEVFDVVSCFVFVGSYLCWMLLCCCVIICDLEVLLLIVLFCFAIFRVV